MCQLTAVNLGDKKLNARYLVLQAQLNSMTEHKDGCGFYSSKGVFKSPHASSILVNFGDKIASLATPDVMFGHVRKATFTNAVKEVKLENSHPFVNDHLALMHNGTLEFRDSGRMKEEKFKDMIDSQIFLEVLTDKFTANGFNFLEAIKDAYGEFYGKFAFLIHDKHNNIFYACRGQTADLNLFVLEGDINGWAINTEHFSFMKGLIFFQGQMCLERKMFSLLEKTPTLLKENTIFTLGDTVEPVGELKEEKKVYVQAVTAGKDTDYWGRPTSYTYNRNDTVKPSPLTLAIKECMDKFKVSLGYMDVLFLLLYGVGIGQVNQDIALNFQNEFMPFAMNTLYNFHVTKEWDKLAKGGTVDYKVHEEFTEIPFPYFSTKDVSIFKDAKKRRVEDDWKV